MLLQINYVKTCAPFVVFPTNRIAHFVEVSLYLFYLAQQVNLLRRMDKIYPSDKSHCTAFSGACGLYRNKMLCERLVGKTRTLLKINGQLKMTLSVL